MRTMALCCLITLSCFVTGPGAARAQTPGTIQLGGAINAANTTASGSGTLTDNANNLANVIDQGSGVPVGNTGQTSSNFPSISNNPILSTGGTPISGTGATVPTATTSTVDGVVFDNLTNIPTSTTPSTVPSNITTTGTGVTDTTGTVTGGIASNGVSAGTGGATGVATGVSGINGAAAGTGSATITPAQFDSTAPASAAATGTTPTGGTAAVVNLGSGATGVTSTTSAECLAVQDCVDNSLPTQTQSCAAASAACGGIQQESTAISAGVLALRSIQQRQCNRTFTSQRSCLRCYNRAARQLRFSQDQALLFGLFSNAAALVRQQAAEVCGALP